MSSSRIVPLLVGRYALHGEVASGGMATVHFGRLRAAAGFARTVAVKRLHPHFARDPEFVSMFVDEARLAARVRHPNVVPTLDVVAQDGELFLVMEYVHGESLGRLARAARIRNEKIPVGIVAAIVSGALHGLHAAHEAADERGVPLDLLHRDISPQNILVGTDGVARVLDFGVAKAAGRLQVTRDGEVKGKLSYMAPEQLRRQTIDRRADVYSAGVVLWELLTGRRLFELESEGAVVIAVLEHRIDPPSAHAPDVTPELDELTLRALAIDPTARFGTARQMALALDRCVRVASAVQVAEWVDGLAGEVLADRARAIAAMEEGVEAVTAPAQTPAPRRKARWGAAIAFFAGVAATGGVVALMRPAPAPAAAPEPAPEPAPVSASALASETVTESVPAPAPDPAPPSDTAVASVRAPRVAPRSVTKPRCTVKAYTDSAGIKHFFNDCGP